MTWIAWWLFENWMLVAYAVAVVVAYVIGGWRLALGVATLGAGVMLYRQGHKDAERQHDQRADDIERRRRDAYEEIDARGTDGSDVSERLLKGDY